MSHKVVLNHFKIIKEAEMIKDGAIELVDNKVLKLHYHYRENDSFIDGRGMVLLPKEDIDYDQYEYLSSPLVIDKSNLDIFDKMLYLRLDDFNDEELRFIFKYGDFKKIAIKTKDFRRLRSLDLDFIDIYQMCILNFKNKLAGFKKGRYFKAYVLTNTGKIIMEV